MRSGPGWNRSIPLSWMFGCETSRMERFLRGNIQARFRMCSLSQIGQTCSSLREAISLCLSLSRSPPCEQGRPAWLGGGASRVEAARVGQAGAARPRREQDGARAGLRVRLGSGNGCRRLSRAKGQTHYYRPHLLRWLGQPPLFFPY